MQVLQFGAIFSQSENMFSAHCSPYLSVAQVLFLALG